MYDGKEILDSSPIAKAFRASLGAGKLLTERTKKRRRIVSAAGAYNSASFIFPAFTESYESCD